MYLYVCVHLNVGALRGYKRVSKPLENVMGSCVMPGMDAGNQTQVLHKRSKFP